MLLIQIAIGLGSALAMIYVGRATRHERALFGYALLIGSFWYVFFAAIDGQTLTELLPQIGGAVIFATLAILGLRYSMAYIGVGWLLHIVWDVGSPLFSDVSSAPSWTAPVCIGFDIPVGTYLLLRARGFLPISSSLHDNPSAARD